MKSTEGIVFLLLLIAAAVLLWMAVAARRAGKRRAFNHLLLAFGMAAIYPLFSILDIYSAPDPRECFHRVVSFHPGPEFSKILVHQEKGWLGGYRAFIKFNAGPDTRIPTLAGLKVSQTPRNDWQEYLPQYDVPAWWNLPVDSPTFKAHYNVERLRAGNGGTTAGKVTFFGYDTATGESFVYFNEP